MWAETCHKQPFSRTIKIRISTLIQLSLKIQPSAIFLKGFTVPSYIKPGVWFLQPNEGRSFQNGRIFLLEICHPQKLSSGPKAAHLNKLCSWNLEQIMKTPIFRVQKSSICQTTPPSLHSWNNFCYSFLLHDSPSNSFVPGLTLQVYDWHFGCFFRVPIPFLAEVPPSWKVAKTRQICFANKSIMDPISCGTSHEKFLPPPPHPCLVTV